jgi:hypothetical protein
VGGAGAMANHRSGERESDGETKAGRFGSGVMSGSKDFFFARKGNHIIRIP